METSTLSLPNTTYAVLGLLSFGQELSGYEVRKWAENLRFFYWSPAQSQIYAELRRLAKLGLVESREVEQRGKPDKRLYKINERGLEALRQWLNEAPVEPPVLKHATCLRLFFGHLAKPERLEHVLKTFIRETEELLDDLRAVHARIDPQPRFSYPALVASWGLRYYQAEIDTAREILARLPEATRQPLTEDIATQELQ